MEENTRADLELCKAGETGVLKFGITRSHSDSVVQTLLRRYSDHHPKIHYELYERSFNELIEALDAGLIECAAIRSAR